MNAAKLLTFSLSVLAALMLAFAVIPGADAETVGGYDFDAKLAEGLYNEETGTGYHDLGTQSLCAYKFDFQFSGSNAESIFWYFGFDDENGNPVTSTEFHPGVITFPAKGTYTIWQVTSNSYEGLSETYCKQTLVVLGSPEVTFNTNGGSAVEMQVVSYGKTATAPADPVKDGHAFGGWFTDAELTQRFDFTTSLTEHITLYAKWIETVTVTFNTDGGNAIASKTVAKGSVLETVETSVKNGYRFDGWFTDSGKTTAFDATAAINSDITLYAKWYQPVITFNTNGGSELAQLAVPYNTTAQLPAAPVKADCIFAGWFYDAEFTRNFDSTALIVNDVTLYAKWTLISDIPEDEVVVSFELNGGSPQMQPVYVLKGNKVTQPSVPVKEGYTFAGWYSDAELTAEYDFSAAVNSNITLYAKWTPVSDAPAEEDDGISIIIPIAVIFGIIALAGIYFATKKGGF